jgi:hypothetical protein
MGSFRTADGEVVPVAAAEVTAGDEEVEAAGGGGDGVDANGTKGAVVLGGAGSGAGFEVGSLAAAAAEAALIAGTVGG